MTFPYDPTCEEVIQEDRDAAERLLDDLHPDHANNSDDPIFCLGINIAMGNEDSNVYVQAFRAYRLKTVAEMKRG